MKRDGRPSVAPDSADDLGAQPRENCTFQKDLGPKLGPKPPGAPPLRNEETPPERGFFL
jgi:hypothetical protein